jgi:predicted nucleic acid-binding protein
MTGMLIYFDSVILIYLFDHSGSFNGRALARLTTLQAAGDQIAVSDLTRLECRVLPVKLGDATKLVVYDSFFARSDVHLVPMPAAVYDQATLIRATHNFKLADSLHLASAANAGCDRFLTNDTRLSRFADIAIEILP